jgi:hypothetical protein
MTRCRTAFLLACGLLASSVRADAQEPIIKPTAGATTTIERLPAPTPVTATQLPDGRILVSWKRLAGATSYALWRSVPPAGIVALSDRPSDTVYVDADVKAGSWYYYNVAGVGEGGTIGLRGGASVEAKLSAGSTTTATTTTAATPPPPAPVAVRALGPVFVVTWHATGSASRYDVRRLEFRPSAADSTKPEGSATSARLFSVSSQLPKEYRDTLTPVTAPRLVAYRVEAFGLFGTSQGAAMSPYLYVPGTPLTDSVTTTTTAALAPTTVVPALGVTLLVGTSASLAQRPGVAGAQWFSLDPAVVAVTPDGTATARSAGTVSVLALMPASDGSVRVLVVRVTVPQ